MFFFVFSPPKNWGKMRWTHFDGPAYVWNGLVWVETTKQFFFKMIGTPISMAAEGADGRRLRKKELDSRWWVKVRDKTFQFMARESIPQRPPHLQRRARGAPSVCEICEICEAYRFWQEFLHRQSLILSKFRVNLFKHRWIDGKSTVLFLVESHFALHLYIYISTVDVIFFQGNLPPQIWMKLDDLARPERFFEVIFACAIRETVYLKKRLL